MSTVFFDIWQNPVYVSGEYVQHRERILAKSAISTFRVKNRRVLINHYNHNDEGPTMCIMFETKEDAQAMFNGLRETMFDHSEKMPEVRCLSRLTRWLNLF